jgi:hypothetical protein
MIKIIKENTILFILMGFTVLGKIDKLETESPHDIRKLVNQVIQKRFVKKPGQRIFLDYKLDISPDSLEIFPKNLFTALLLFGYDIPFTLNTPFKLWKNFIISYGPSCTGFFLA